MKRVNRLTQWGSYRKCPNHTLILPKCSSSFTITMKSPNEM